MSQSPVSVGDILMLSQLAWRLTCSFTAGQTGAPADFADVENELKALTKSLNTICETLDEDGSLLARANLGTRRGTLVILTNCQRTLEDLDIFVNSYQDVKKVAQPGGGKVIQRSWRPFFLKNYQTILWTTEGGDIHALRSILSLHSQSITITFEALQSRNLRRLESAVVAVAEKIELIHSRFDEDIETRIAEIQKVLTIIRNRYDGGAGTPDTWPNRESSLSDNIPSYYVANTSRSRVRREPSREPLRAPTSPPSIPPRSVLRVPSSASSASDPRKQSQVSNESDSRLGANGSISDRSDSVASATSPRTTRIDAHLDVERARRNVGSVDSISHDLHRIELSSSNRAPSTRGRVTSPITSPASTLRDDPFLAAVLPSSAMSPRSPSEDPFRQIRMLGKPQPPSMIDKDEIGRGNNAESWSKMLFTNSAILCDERCATVEFTKPDENKLGDFVMEAACKAARLCLVTKGQKLQSGGIRYTTSVWVIADDGSTVLQQKLPDDEEVVPYTVWDNRTKIVLRVATELRFYSGVPESIPKRLAQTAWVNYIFDTERPATNFQNALMTKTLITSIRTRRTMRIFPGVAGAFATEQQLCALENLRIFQDHDSSTVYGMIHFVPEFSTGNGYLTIPLNDPKDPIRLKETNDTTVQIKGLKILLPQRSRRPSASNTKSAKKEQEKFIAGVKMEFYAKEDKTKFMAQLKQIQDSSTSAATMPA